jgi:hypothetical protein
MGLPPKILQRGVKDRVRISDARMSGTAPGALAVTANPERQSSLAGRGTMTKTIAGGCYFAVQPPSIRMSVPVIKLAHSEQR